MYRLMQCLCSATNTTPLSKQRCLWLRLLLEVLTLSPSHAGTPALQLPLTVASSAAGQDAVPDTAADVAAAEAALLQVWQDIGGWTAHPDIRGGWTGIEKAVCSGACCIAFSVAMGSGRLQPQGCGVRQDCPSGVVCVI